MRFSRGIARPKDWQLSFSTSRLGFILISVFSVLSCHPFVLLFLVFLPPTVLAYSNPVVVPDWRRQYGSCGRAAVRFALSRHWFYPIGSVRILSL